MHELPADLSLLYQQGKYKADLQKLRFIMKTNIFILNFTNTFAISPIGDSTLKGLYFSIKFKNFLKKLFLPSGEGGTLENVHFSRLIA